MYVHLYINPNIMRARWLLSLYGIQSGFGNESHNLGFIQSIFIYNGIIIRVSFTQWISLSVRIIIIILCGFSVF